MYRLANIIPNDMALNLIPEISFNPSGTLFAVTHQQANEIESALDAEGITMIAVPDELADEVRALIARKRSA